MFVSEVLPTLSNPELVTLAVEPPDATRFLSLPTRPVVQSPAFPRQLNPATAKSPLPVVVRTTLGVVLEPVLTALPPTPETPLYTKTTSAFLPEAPPAKFAVTVYVALVVATVKYDICSKTVAPVSVSVFTSVGESDSLSVKVTVPPWAPATATTIFPAVTLIAAVVAVFAAEVAVVEVTRVMEAYTGLT